MAHERPFTEHFKLGDNISPKGFSPVLVTRITADTILCKPQPYELNATGSVAHEEEETVAAPRPRKQVATAAQPVDAVTSTDGA